MCCWGWEAQDTGPGPRRPPGFVKCASSLSTYSIAATMPPSTPFPREVAWVVGRKMSVARADIYTCQCREQVQEQTWRPAWPAGARSGLQSLPGVQGLSPSWWTHQSRHHKISSGSGFEFWITLVSEILGKLLNFSVCQRPPL